MSLPMCRVCMRSSLEYIDFESSFGNNGDCTYMECFNQCTKLNASYVDKLPKNLCSDCGIQLKMTFNFIKKAEEADRTFKNQLNLENKQISSNAVLFDWKVKIEECSTMSMASDFDEDLEILCEYEDHLNLQNKEDHLESAESIEESIDWLHMCNICNINFLCESTFKLHYEKFHKNANDKIDYDDAILHDESNSIECFSKPKPLKQVEQKSSLPSFVCARCDKVFNSSVRLEYHLNWHKGIRPYSCPHCKNNYFSNIILNLHIKRVHLNDGNQSKNDILDPKTTDEKPTEELIIVKPSDKPLHKCDECEKLFPTHIHLLRHKNNVHSKKFSIFLCSSCPKTFKNSSLLRNHEKTHTNREIKFTCDECGKGFFLRSSYKAHLKIHSPDRPKYTCDVCNRKFSFKTGLNMHMKIHTGGDFECMQCGKLFVRNNDLEIHMRFHTGDYPFPCSVCNKRFAIKSHLKEHLARHSGIKVKCNECDAEFVNKSTLRSHMYIHSKMPFTCIHCEKGFNSRYKIKRHILHVHKIPVSEEEFDQLFPKRNIIHEKNIKLNGD